MPGTPEIDEREQAASLARIEAGELPLAAERRLKALRDTPAQGFTSDLSVAEFALGHELGLAPLSQVMGSCVYQVGWQYGYGGSYSWDGSMFEELQVLTEAWNDARERAMYRMAQETGLAGGNVVVGVHLRREEHDWAEGAIEYIFTGTAVRDPQATGKYVVLTDLSLQDYWKLRQAGIQPCGLVAASSCFFVHRGMMAPGRGLLNWGNEEIPEYTRGVYAARETALGRLTEQARQIGAEGVVGVDFEHTIALQDVKMGGGNVRGLVVTIHVMGTAVRGTASAHPSVPDLQIPLNETRTSA